MCGEKAWKLSCAATVAIFIAYGLLLMYYQASPNSAATPQLLLSFLRPASYPTTHVQKEELLAGGTQESSSGCYTFNCKDLGLKEEKVIQEGQLYHMSQLNVDVNAKCRSKHEHQCFRKNSPFVPLMFLEALRRYELYHDKCTRDVNITALGIAGDAPEGCKYLVWKAKDGMGNQLLSLVCAFIYSLLTQRVMLIATDSHIQNHLCNPFPLSSWLLPDNFPEPRLRTEAKRVATFLADTLAQMHDPTHNMSISPKHLQVFITCCDKGRDHPFFCPASQKLFTGINWIFYHSHEHTLPAFYLIPEFREKLNQWFPNHDAFTHASRYLLHPKDAIWEHISQFFKSHMDGVQKQIGIQARVWGKNYEPPVSRQILRCAIEHMLLPKPPPQLGILSHQSIATPANATLIEARKIYPDISVLVASLRNEYRDDLASQYVNYDGRNNSIHVSVITASTERSQRTGNAAHDEAAIVDIWLLSFMHEMVITPYSTFGSVASGMAGIVPLLFMNYGKDKVKEAACARSNVAGPCFLVYPRKQACELDPPSFSILDPGAMVPEVKHCNFYNGLGIESTFYIP